MDYNKLRDNGTGRDIFVNMLIAASSLFVNGFGIGTLICAFASGPIMQFAFYTMHFDATGIKHQNLRESLKVMRRK